METIEFTVPVRTESPNARAFRGVSKAGRIYRSGLSKTEKIATIYAGQAVFVAYQAKHGERWEPVFPAKVTLVRCSPGKLDTDNLAGALKHVRDGVASLLGVDDGSASVRWHYGQRKSKAGIHGVRVIIEPLGVLFRCPHCQGLVSEHDLEQVEAP